MPLTGRRRSYIGPGGGAGGRGGRGGGGLGPGLGGRVVGADLYMATFRSRLVTDRAIF